MPCGLWHAVKRKEKKNMNWFHYARLIFVEELHHAEDHNNMIPQNLNFKDKLKSENVKFFGYWEKQYLMISLFMRISLWKN